MVLQTLNLKCINKKYREFTFKFLYLFRCFGFAGFQSGFSQISLVVFILPGLCFHFLKHSFEVMSELCHLVIRLDSPLPPAPLPLLWVLDRNEISFKAWYDFLCSLHAEFKNCNGCMGSTKSPHPQKLCFFSHPVSPVPKIWCQKLS